jgi:quinol monooxygenase YgiN
LGDATEGTGFRRTEHGRVGSTWIPRPQLEEIEMTKTTVGLLIRLEAQPGKEASVQQFLESAISIVDAEPGTTAWFALRLGPSTFGIFNAFPDEASRQAHIGGLGGQALSAHAAELFAQPPAIEAVDVVAAKLPG